MNYWDIYYGGREVPVLPSQFAVFVLGEYRPDAVLDIGCGSGRDSFWFAQQGLKTIGVDGSRAAVDLCSQRATGNDNLKFLQADVGSSSLAEELLAEFTGSPLIYARFFLHAIDEAGQSALLDHAAKILNDRGGKFAVEYRTVRDMSLTKSTADHYRRFIQPSDLVAEANSKGLSCRYAVEGFGFAKYKTDDAYVARMIFETSS